MAVFVIGTILESEFDRAKTYTSIDGKYVNIEIVIPKDLLKDTSPDGEEALAGFMVLGEEAVKEALEWAHSYVKHMPGVRYTFVR